MRLIIYMKLMVPTTIRNTQDEDDIGDRMAHHHLSKMSKQETKAMALLEEIGKSEFVKKLVCGLISLNHRKDFFVALCEYFIVLWNLLPIFKTETVTHLSFASEAFMIHQLYEFIYSHSKIHALQDAVHSIDLFGKYIYLDVGHIFSS